MKIEESNILFEFPDDNITIKFDQDPYYTKHFKKMPYAKGVDFISVSRDTLLFLEVKNCLGYEEDNTWRIHPDNRKTMTLKTSVDITGRESLDIEIAQKVAMTIASIVGAFSYGKRRETTEKILPFADEILSKQFMQDKKQWVIILFLEGDFKSVTRSKRMIMQNLQDSIKKKLNWLNCRVSVVDSDTYRSKYFSIGKPKFL